MVRKHPSPAARAKRRSTSTRSRAAEARTRPAETRNNNEDLSGDELTALVVRGCLKRDVSHAQIVLKSDPEVDRLCHSLFQRHLAEPNIPSGQQNFDVLLAAQALERIGDHAKNLAEELYSLAEGRSLRHNARK